jgi:hypothetical protein
LGLLASTVFLFLMWETRLVRAQAFTAIRGGGAILAMVLLLLLSMLIGWLIGGPDPGSRRILGDLHQHAQCHCRALCRAVLLSGHQCLYGPDCLPVPEGAHKTWFSIWRSRMAQTAAEGATRRNAMK